MIKRDLVQFTLAIILLQLFVFSLNSSYAVSQENPVSDIHLDPMILTAKVHGDGSTTLIFDANVSNTGQESISSIDIRVDSLDLRILSASSTADVIDTSMRNMERHTMVSLHLAHDISVNDSVHVHLEVLTKDLQSAFEQNQTANSLHGSMTYYMRPHYPVSNFTFITILPSYASLSYESVVPLYPESDSNFTDGRSIGFVWYNQRILPGQENVFIVRYQITAPAQLQSQISILLLGLTGIIGIISGYGVSLLIPRIKTRFRNMAEKQYVGATSEERMILEIIKESNGSCPQQDVYQQLDISESKLSLILGGLEEKGLVKRIRKGRENIVHIVEDTK